MKTLYFHIGFPKTGTTTLYEHIMPNLQDIATFAPNTSQKVLKTRLNNHQLGQSLVLKECLETFLYQKSGHEAAIKIIQSVSNEKIFLSTVNLMAGQFFEGLYTDKGSYVDASLIAQRIYEVFSNHFNVKILISVRAQADWIHSAFAEWHNLLPKVSGGGDFSKFITACITPGTPQYVALDYYSLGSVFEQVFGPENVTFVCYEELQMSPASYFSKIASLVGSSLAVDKLHSIPRANNRSVGTSSKKTDVDSIMLFLFSLKMKYFPNVRFNIANRVPFLVNLLGSLNIPSHKIIELSEDHKTLIKRAFSESNKLFIEKYSPKADFASSYLYSTVNRSF